MDLVSVIMAMSPHAKGQTSSLRGLGDKANLIIRQLTNLISKGNSGHTLQSHEKCIVLEQL